MAWALLMTLVWATSASAVRYSDYSGVKMPYYGSNDDERARDVGQLAVAAEDYQGHSPDASASLDYKYDDDRLGISEKPVMESNDVVKWNKLDRKHRELLRPPEKNDLVDSYIPQTETATKLKANRCFSKHRSRLKRRHFYKDGEVSPQWSVKNVHAKKYKSGNMKDDFNIDEYQARDVEQEDLDMDNESYRQREVTERVVRRRPRDKLFSRIRPNIETPNDDIGLDSKIKRERRVNLYNLPDDENHDRQRRPYRPIQEDEENQELGVSDKQPEKAYEDYGDYYDMKRVHNIKSKLPKLLRRPTARVDTTLAASSYEIDALWTYRRLNPSTLESQASSPSTISTSSSTETSTPTTPAPLPTKELSKTAPKELSLAEKSKLSILKKAQRKENMHKDMLSQKPPVLLQVTNKMLTVVVVEPPTSAVPWMRASILVHDTPERLERAKMLMRNKLVARARNIQELTDNWDEVICDYIDTSLLDSVPQINRYYVLYIAEIFLLFVVR